MIHAIALTLISQLVQPAPDRYLLVRCGTLIAVPGKPPERDRTIVVKNGVIERVVARAEEPPPATAPATTEILDCSTRWVMPGLIDCHVHLTMTFDDRLRLRTVTETDELTTLRTADNARKTLEAGFTTVRDLGAFRPQVIFAVRDAINEGLILGPRILAAGHAIAITGGHGDHTNGYREEVWGEPTATDGVGDGTDACMKAVRTQIKLGADVVKLTATGGVLSASAAGLRQHFTDEELKAIVTAAHMMGRKVAAHAHGADGIAAALKAGVDSIEHGTYLDKEGIQLILRGCQDNNGPRQYLVPTMLAAFTVAENAEKPGYYLPMVAAKARVVGPRLREAVKAAHEARVLIAFGTDSGVSEHGINAREFQLLVEAGMTPTETLVAATLSAADLLGIEKEAGTIEPGKVADLIATDADPTRDVKTLMSIPVVVKSGRVAKLTK